MQAIVLQILCSTARLQALSVRRIHNGHLICHAESWEASGHAREVRLALSPLMTNGVLFKLRWLPSLMSGS